MRVHRVTRQLKPFVLLLPLIILFAILAISLITSIIQSFGYMPEYGNDDFTFEYFINLFTSSVFVEELYRSIVVSFISALITAVVGVLLAWCIVTALDGKGLLNQITKLPMLVPFSVCSLCVVTLAASTGFIPRVMMALGIEGASDLFSQVLYYPNSIGVVLVFTFHLSSYFIYMVVDTMKRISTSMGEAALNLGASQWFSFRKIVLPYCMPTIRNAFIFCFVIAFGNYEVPLLVGSSISKLLPVHAYIEYTNYSFATHRPIAMAINVVMLVIAVVVVLIIHIWDTRDRKRLGVSW